MANQLYNMLNSGGNQIPSFFNALNQFRSMLNGDPRQQVMQQVSNLGLTQSQFEEIQNTARQIQNMLSR